MPKFEMSTESNKMNDLNENKKVLLEKATSLAIAFHNVGVEEEFFKNTENAI